MKRWVWFGLLVAVIVLIWALKPQLLARYLSSRLGIPVAISSLEVGRATTVMGNFRVQNPSGYRRKEACAVGRTTVRYNWRKLFATPSEIEVIALEEVILSIEFNNILGTQNNWTQIVQKLPSRSQKEVIIHRLTIDNLTVEIRGLGLNGAVQTRHVEHIELSELNSQEGFPTQELIAQIFGKSGLQQYLQDLTNPPKVLKKLLNNF